MLSRPMGWERGREGQRWRSEGIPGGLVSGSSFPTPPALGPGKRVMRRQKEEVSLPGFFFSPELAEGRDWQR